MTITLKRQKLKRDVLRIRHYPETDELKIGIDQPTSGPAGLHFVFDKVSARSLRDFLNQADLPSRIFEQIKGEKPTISPL